MAIGRWQLGCIECCPWQLLKPPTQPQMWHWLKLQDNRKKVAGCTLEKSKVYILTPDFCETLISISKLRLSRKTLISFSISTLNFVVRTLILILKLSKIWDIVAPSVPRKRSERPAFQLPLPHYIICYAMPFARTRKRYHTKNLC